MKISVPATSANLGIGFDAIGLSLSLYNTFSFTKSRNDHIVSYSGELDDHLVYQAYKAFFTYHRRPHLPITIEVEQQEIPISRGLGSSAACILAGVFAANTLGHLNASFDECVAFSASLEGHPDNIYPAAYGGLVATYQDNDIYYHQSFPVHSSLQFTLLIPDQHTSTSDLRNAIPTTIKHQDAVHNVARVLHLPSAFKTGNLQTLRRILNDKLHEPYRYPFIPKSNEILTLKRHKELAIVISGSGSSLLFISKKPIDAYLTDSIKSVYRVVPVQPEAKLTMDKKTI
ncbi:homoserine kinase [Candidatus Xianfuyuplasma coldseepsis]|uniref:Homoserine kinase n=1 Tax=Candidatus Xianfuyuplasma coldseepsis TaxID=2782163 RepID=A0A7L7KPA9_9MOLU|nr:homoserine kinase [Xianfuyuplasma coldseepsis]QMS84375.1 homoserine kinase [Xianfuyuplasma coldseepsis]